MLLYKDLPEWCRLEFNEEKVTIDFVLHKDVIGVATDGKVLAENIGWKGFIDTESAWGIDGCLKKTAESDGGIRIIVDPPSIRKRKDTKCKDCKGTGKSETSYDGLCSRCDGEGKDFEFDHADAIKVSQSLAILTDLLQKMILGDEKTTSSQFQLMSTWIGSRTGFYPIGGYYSRVFVNWLRSKGEISTHSGCMEDVVDAMTSVWKKMDGREELRPYRVEDFWLNTYDSGWLNISCPGDACGLHPSDGHVDKNRNEGYEYSCHNMDMPMQQLTLLAALAKLESKCRKELGV